MVEVQKRVLMTFLTELGRKVSFYVEDPRDNLTEAEIKACMDLIIEKNVFAPYNTSLVSLVEAKVVETNTTEFDLVV